MMRNISIRLSKDLMEEAERLAKLQLVDKSVIIREALQKGFMDLKLRMAVEMFSRGKFSTSGAAKLAGLSVGEMMDELVKRGIKPAISKEDIKGSLERALRLIK